MTIARVGVMLQRLLLALMLATTAIGTAAASTNEAGVNYDTETFLRERLLAGQDVDLGQGCRGPASNAPDLGVVDTRAKAEPCDPVSGAGFVRLLQEKAIVQALPAHGLVVTGLHVRDAVELRWSSVAENVVCRRCRFDGKLVLEGASFDRGLRFEASELRGGIDARAAQVHGRVSFVDATKVTGLADFSTATLSDMLETDDASFVDKLDLSRAKIGLVRLAGTTFEGGIQADDAIVGGTVTLDDRTRILGQGLVARGMTVGSYFKFGEPSGKVEPSRGTSEVSGLNLTSARLRAGLEIGNTKVGSRSEIIDDPRFTSAGIVLINATIDGALRIDGATIEGAVDADGLVIAKALQSRRSLYAAPISLHHATIGGDVDFADKSLTGLAAQKMHVGGSLYLKNVSAETVDMRGATIGADVDIVDARISGNLEFDQATIGKHLGIEGATRVEGDAHFAGSAMSDLVIGIDPALTTTRVRFDEADLSLIKVSSSVFMRSVAFKKPLLLVAADIKGHLDLVTAQIVKLDMTRASIGGDFRLAERRDENLARGKMPKAAPTITQWAHDAELDLKNAHVGVIQDEGATTRIGAWPAKLELEGFTYDHFADPPDLDRALAWLGKVESNPHPFSPGPFVRLARHFTDEGNKELGDKVLFEAKERERHEAWGRCDLYHSGSCAHAIGLCALWLLIGYGIGNGLFKALIWVIAMTALGALVLARTRDENQHRVWWGGRGKGFIWCLGASANHLIPLVELNSEFKKFFDDPTRTRLRSWQLMYFAAHAVMGYVLASFVVAAIGGLTQAH